MAKELIPQQLRWTIWERDNFTCRYCGSRKNLSLDHLIAEVRGGTATLENLITACKSCNSSKGSASVGEFLRRLDAVGIKSLYAAVEEIDAELQIAEKQRRAFALGRDAAKILDALHASPGGMTGTQIVRLFANHKGRTTLEKVLDQLVQWGRIECRKIPTGGRTKTVWILIATAPKASATMTD